MRAQAPSSFLDEAPQDTFSGLGKAEHPVEDITLDPALERAAAARRDAATTQAAGDRRLQTRRSGTGSPSRAASGSTGARTSACAPRGSTPAPPGPRTAGDDEITGELRPDDAAAVPAQDAPPAPEGKNGGQVAATQPARPAEGGSAAGEVAARSPAPAVTWSRSPTSSSRRAARRSTSRTRTCGGC